jgi:hypothetical protein
VERDRGAVRPLVWAVCRRHDLSRLDIDDVGQSVWLKLVEHLTDIRDPAALPGWIATTTATSVCGCCGPAAPGARPSTWPSRRATRRAGSPRSIRSWNAPSGRSRCGSPFRELRPRCQELLSQLFQEPRPAYRDISATLGMKIGSIGPSRERCLAELRRCPALAALIEADGPGREARRA